MKYFKIYLVLWGASILIGLESCTFVEKHHKGNAVVEVNGQALYRDDIKQLTAHATSPEDSARIADAYIQQWATDVLVYDQAKRKVATSKQIEQMVENYRKTLYVHAYEQQLVTEEMPKHVAEDSIQAFYEAHHERFILKESIVQGLLLVVPNDAPDMKNLRKWLGTIDDETLEKIEKYAYQNALGYELFVDKWQSTQNILLRMPLANNNLTQKLGKENQIEIADSVNTYFLRVTDKRLIGEEMPLEYARDEIERILLSQRQVGFLQEEKRNIYNHAVRVGQIKM